MPNHVSIIKGTNDKPAASADLAQVFASSEGLDGQLLLGYPLIGSPDGKHAIDAVWISPSKGITIFDLVEGREIGDYGARQDDAANKLEARLKTQRDLTSKRDLKINIRAITFAPGVGDTSRWAQEDYELASTSDQLIGLLQQDSWPNHDQRVYEMALSAVQSISTIRTSKAKRITQSDESRGARLRRLEDSIATLDNRQGQAVLETVEGVQRIRGLAGSGKTVVLALKAAYLHAQHPDWRIAVTFNTRSLKGQFKRLINNFSVEQAGEEPDWNQLRILNAWGAPGGGEREGMYHEFCKTHGIDYYDLRTAKNAFGNGREFQHVCEKALVDAVQKQPLYDAILVDEAQDFPPAFLRLCFDFLKETKRLVYAYDELQNLSDDSMPPPEELFGKGPTGSPRVTLSGDGTGTSPRQDIILSKCYRNSRPILVTAHALGFGTYRKPSRYERLGLVQMFDHAELWEEIGYRNRTESLADGASVDLFRPEENSPLFLENHSPIDDLIQFHRFDSEEEQATWVANAIRLNIEEEELRYDDIVVINPDPFTTREKVGPIRSMLLDEEIMSHTAGVDTEADIFFTTFDSVTFTGIFRAKGNEAAMVYIINAQDCNSSAWNLASIRNRLFTAITRSKAWVRVLGVGSGMQALMDEFEEVKANNFELKFNYPTAEQRKQLKIVHRDVSAEEQKRHAKREKSIADWVTELEVGHAHLGDLNADLVARLEELLKRKA